MSNNNQLTWDYCPPELLWNIFKQCPLTSIVNCMSVNRRWRDVADDFIESHDLWKQVAHEQVIDYGASYKKRSTLDWKNIFINSILWSSVSQAQVKFHHIYIIRGFKKMHMYKNKLLVQGKKKMNFYDVTNSKLIKSCNCTGKQAEFVENDYMLVFRIVIYGQCDTLVLCGKEEPDQSVIEQGYYQCVENVLLFKVVDTICYIVTEKAVVWAYRCFVSQWSQELVGRYFGSINDVIVALHVYKDRVSLVTKYGFILCSDPYTKSFDKVASYNTMRPGNVYWALYHCCDVAVSVENQDQLIVVNYDEDRQIILECAGMTCATEHGRMLFIGFEDGQVAICRPQKMVMDQTGPEMVLNLRDFDKNIKDPKVIDLEVYEDILSHHLFIALKDKIIHLLITYPPEIRKYYE